MLSYSSMTWDNFIMRKGAVCELWLKWWYNNAAVNMLQVSAAVSSFYYFMICLCLVCNNKQQNHSFLIFNIFPTHIIEFLYLRTFQNFKFYFCLLWTTEKIIFQSKIIHSKYLLLTLFTSTSIPHLLVSVEQLEYHD